MNSKFTWVMTALIIAGLLSFLGAAFAGITIVEYEYTHEETVTDRSELEGENGGYNPATFDKLSEENQAVAETIITDGSAIVAVSSNFSYYLGEHPVINYGDEHYILDRSIVFDWDSTGGIAVVVLTVSGVLLFAEAFRRQFF